MTEAKAQPELRTQPIFFDKGQITDVPKRAAPPGSFVIAKNVWRHPNGSWVRRPGLSILNGQVGIGTSVRSMKLLAVLRQINATRLIVTDGMDIYWYYDPFTAPPTGVNNRKLINPQYRTGTVTVTNGSAVVTGSGTSWLSANIAENSIFCLKGNEEDPTYWYYVDSVDNDTQITLSGGYAEGTQSGQAYVVMCRLESYEGAVEDRIPDHTSFEDKMVLAWGIEPTMWYGDLATDEKTWADMTDLWSAVSDPWSDVDYVASF
ncbi:MAG: hypothetical protein ACXABY_09975, partial [Candidatus Thorarchaeota archaeon]